MVNFNEQILETSTFLSYENRGYNYGDALFETIKVSNGKVLFWEDHYFRLMASMRIIRMEIPMKFTMEYLEEEIFKTLDANGLRNSSARVKLTVHRNVGGFYTPKNNDVGFIISAIPIEGAYYSLNEQKYQVDLFKDYYVSPSLLSTLKTNNKILNVVGSIYAQENDLDNCLILNTNKQVVEALNGNIFLVNGKQVKTPPLADGCLKGVMRTQVIELLKVLPDYEIKEASISPFELQKADELFITNVISGVQPISKYRKKSFKNNTSQAIVEALNEKLK